MSNTFVVYDASNTLVVSAPGPQGPAGVGGGGGVTDGDKGDVTVSNSGATWTVDAGAVTFAKLQNVTGPALIGRQAATAGSAEAITLGSGLSIDGSKQLTITASYAQQSVTMSAGTGLTGGGDLSANRSFAVDFATSGTTSNTKAVRADDARLSDNRTPTAHTHALADLQQGGATSGQVLEWSGSAWSPATLSGGGGGTVTSVTAGDGLLGGTITGTGTIDVNFGTAGNTVCQGNDSRLSDARTPTAHTHTISEVTDISAFGSSLIDDADAAAARTTLGLGGAAEKDAAFYATASHTHALADLQQGGATSGQVLEWSGSAWTPATPSGGGGGGIDVSTTAFEFSDFINSDLGFAATASGGQVNYSVSGADPGRMWLNTSANGTANARGLLLSNNGLGTIDVQENTSLDLAASAYAGSTGGTNYTGHLRFGYADSQNHILPSNGVYFRSEATGGAPGNWYAVTVNGGTETATDTGTAENATAKRFRINISTISSTRTARFYIDGSLVATHTTNLPTSAVGWMYAAVRTGTETVAKQLYVEWHRHEITRATALSFT